MNNVQETPIQEAVSIITIAAIWIAVGAYVAALKNVPLLSPAPFWMAVQVHLYSQLLRKVETLIASSENRNRQPDLVISEE
jgi:hypothetical protein